MATSPRFLFPVPRFAIALAALSAGLSLRCGGTDEGTTPLPPDGAGASAGEGTVMPRGGAPDASVCEPGETRACVGPGACEGGQQCSRDGEWGACDCGDAPAGGAGGSSSTAGGGGEDAGGMGTGGTGNPVRCSPAPQSGCEEGEKCSVAANVQTQTILLTCVADGTKAEGEQCMNRGDGTDDCAKGLFCNGSGTVPVCHPYCDVTVPSSCETGCLPLNVGHVGTPEASGFGVCQPSCSMLEQDCPGDDACVFVESEFPVCAPPGASAPGEDCFYLDDCEAGSACVFANPAQTANMCTPFCLATEPGVCPEVGDTCVAFPMVYNGVPDALLTTGLCYPCELLPSTVLDCSLLEPGACDEDEDCEPLLDMMGFAYTCSLPAGQCVMAEP